MSTGHGKAGDGLPTLRQKLAHAHRRLVFLALVLSGVTLMASGIITIREFAMRNLALLASTISYEVEPALVFGDTGALRESLASVSRIHDVSMVEVRDPQGRVIARHAADQESSRNPFAQLVEGLIRVPEASVPVRRGTSVLGTVHVHGDPAVMTRYVLSGTVISLACLCIIILAIRLLVRRMEEDIIAPLDRIASVAHAVRGERDFTRRAPTSQIAEIDRFTSDFNALLEELEGWHKTITAENEKLDHEATHDALTGLGNRALFDRTVARLLSEGQSASRRFAVLYLDLDEFKPVNDRHGHQAGDELLGEVARRIAGAIRQHDLAFRLGGDEFAVVLRTAASWSSTAAVTARLRAAMARPVPLDAGAEEVVPAISIGAALHPEDGTDAEALLGAADGRMYQEKLRKRSATSFRESHA